jgi:hypothetical protein
VVCSQIQKEQEKSGTAKFPDVNDEERDQIISAIENDSKVLEDEHFVSLATKWAMKNLGGI